MRSFDNAEGCEDYRSHELEKYRASAGRGNSARAHQAIERHAADSEEVPEFVNRVEAWQW
jgi:hypothetical protein